MDRAFPLGFPFATAFYLTLYVLTLVVHVVFMNYVLAGTGYLAIAGLGRWLKKRGGGELRVNAIFEVLRDWMPFALGAAITAAVAPLLFLQILYRENFYTANLLLFHRWMSIVPVLIVGFYLLYLMKSKWMERRSAGWFAAVAIGALACFAFTGYTWTENHLLSLDRAVWPSHYESGAMRYENPLLLPRFLLWVAGSIATMATFVAWQLKAPGGKAAVVKEHDISAAIRPLANLALGGIALSVLVGGWYGWLLQKSPVGESSDAVCFTSPLVRPYAIVSIVGLLTQLGGWIAQRRRQRFSSVSLVLISAGLLATMIGMNVVRESIRLASVDITKLYDQHAKAAQVGGWWVFALFLAVNAGLIAWAIRLVRPGKSVKRREP